jgi:hypothetical protein
VLDAAHLSTLQQFFDTVAYVRVTTLFGQPTDTDGYAPIHILITPLPRYADSAMMGYFYSGDKYTTAQVPSSNEADIFYLTVPQEEAEMASIEGTLAHEFQHMVNFDRHRAKSSDTEVVWLNEALSLTAEQLSIDNSDPGLPIYLNGSTVSLTQWHSGDLSALLANYAGSKLFGIYLYDRFVRTGLRPNLLATLVDSSTPGLRNVADATGVAFNELFLDWTIALAVSDTGVTTDPQFQYTTLNLRANGLSGLKTANTIDLTSAFTNSASVEPYTPMVVGLASIHTADGMKVTGTGAAGAVFKP